MLSRILYLFFSALIIVSFSACGAEDTTSDTTSSSTTITTITSEGSSSSFVNLILDQTHSAQVGTYLTNDGNSYYKFTSTDAGTYTITASNLSGLADLNFQVYSNSDFITGYVGSTFSSLESGETLEVDLYANTIYYLRVTNSYVAVTFSLLIDAPESIVTINDGTPSSPISLSKDATYNTKVGSSSDDTLRYSYYKFTTSVSGDYTISTSSLSSTANLDTYLYSDSIFITQIDSAYRSASLTAGLSGSTTYYIKIKNYTDIDITFDLLVTSPTIVIGTNNAPTIIDISDQSSDVNVAITDINVNASDTDGDNLTYSASGLPNGLSIDTSTGVISGTPTSTGIYTITVSVSDGSDSVSTSFDYTVTLSNSSCIDNTISGCTEVVTPGTDYSDTYSGSGSLYYEFNAIASSHTIASYNPDGLAWQVYDTSNTLLRTCLSLTVDSVYGIGYKTECTASSLTIGDTYILKLLTTDESSGNSGDIVISIDDPTAPTLSLDRDTLSVYVDTSGTITATATTDGTTTDTINASSSDTAIATVSVSGTIITVTGVSAGSTTLTVTSGSDKNTTAVITVITSSNEGTTENPISLTLDTLHNAKIGSSYNSTEKYSYYKFTTSVSGDYSYTVAYTNIDSADLDFTLYTTAIGSGSLGINYGNTSGTFSSLDASSTYYLKVLNYNSSDITYDITINAPVTPNNAPTITAISDQGSNVDIAITNIDVNASDSDGDTLTYSETGLPTGLSINTSTGVISGTPSVTGVFSVTVTVSDGTDTASASFNYAVGVASSIAEDPNSYSNNSYSDAFSMTLNESVRDVVGDLDDWYTFTTTINTVYEIRLNKFIDNGGIDLEFYTDPLGSIEFTRDVNNEDLNDTILTEFQAVATTYYVKATNHYYGSYSLDVDSTPYELNITAAIDDDSSNTALSMSLDNNYSNILHQTIDDIDWLKINVTSGVEYTITSLVSGGGATIYFYYGSDLSTSITSKYYYYSTTAKTVTITPTSDDVLYMKYDSSSYYSPYWINISSNASSSTAPTLSLDNSTLSIDESSTGTITATATTDGTTADTITAISSDTDVATVLVSGDTITVSGVSAGTTTITVTSGSGENQICSVTVNSTSSVTNVFSSSTQYPIPDGDISTGLTSSISVSNAVTSISKATVTIDITHSWDSDLDIYLISPAGTEVELSTDNGGTSSDYTDTLFDDSSLTNIIDASAPFTGTFSPEGSLSDFSAENANGTWSLRIYDDTSVDTGTLNSWSMTIE